MSRMKEHKSTMTKMTHSGYFFPSNVIEAALCPAMNGCPSFMIDASH